MDGEAEGQTKITTLFDPEKNSTVPKKGIKIFTWNARVLGAPNKQHLVKCSLNKSYIDIVLLQETKMGKVDMSNFNKKLYHWQIEMVDSIGASGGLAILWKKSTITYTCCTKMQNWMAGKIRSLNRNLEFTILNVYGSTVMGKKKLVWQEIDIFLKNQEAQHIVIGGDFNTILHQTKKCGGIRTIQQAQKDFAEWISRNNILEIRTEKGIHTWNNRRLGVCNITKTLHRFFFK